MFADHLFNTCNAFEAQNGLPVRFHFRRVVAASEEVPPQAPQDGSSLHIWVHFFATTRVGVLQWRARNKSRFPHLSRMAQQFLAVPATSASAERVFSLAGRIFSDLTQNQSDTTLEDRMLD